MSDPFYSDPEPYDLGERFALVYVARNSLLPLHAADDLLACFAFAGGAFTGASRHQVCVCRAG
ncbi:MAG: hypothetical protein AB1941_15475 [Gemmatimonadota bacterium]